jgi:hypothetical protein
MKTITSSLLLILIAIGSASLAQESSVGIKGGLNLSTISTDEGSDKNLKPGFHIGVFNKIALSESVALQPELLFATKGLKINYDESPIADGETRFNTNYIDLPVYLALNVSEAFQIQFGPYVSYLISANVDTDAEVFDFFQIDSNDELDRKNFNAFDYGVAAGISFDLDPLVIGANYSLGLNPVAKEDEPSRDMLGDAKNSVIQIFAGIKF